MVDPGIIYTLCIGEVGKPRLQRGGSVTLFLGFAIKDILNNRFPICDVRRFEHQFLVLVCHQIAEFIVVSALSP